MRLPMRLIKSPGVLVRGFFLPQILRFPWTKSLLPFDCNHLKYAILGKLKKNRFIERDWETDDPQEIRDYLRDDLLLLRNIRNKKIHVRWEPTGNCQGKFVL